MFTTIIFGSFFFLGVFTLGEALAELAYVAYQKKQIAKTLEQLDRYADHTDNRLADLEKRIDRQKQLNKEILEETEAVLADLIAENKKYDQSGEILMNESTQTEQAPLSRLDTVMERALLIENMIQSMDLSLKTMSDDDLTQEEYDAFMEEYRNLNDELDALYDLSIELGYTNDYTMTRTY